MTTERRHMQVGGLRVEVVRKDIKNLHVGVHPPHGRVRVAAPLRLDDEAVRLALVSRLGWIHRQRKSFAEQERQSKREMVSGESHYFLGRRYRLALVEHNGAVAVRFRNGSTMELRVRPVANRKSREVTLHKWYRQQMRELVDDLVAKWEPRIGVKIGQWGIKRMKTRWGTCNADAARVWLNLELIKKPKACIEYILVHEMVHLLERQHNDHFKEHMERHLPQWRLFRAELNRAPLAHEDWKY